MIQGKIFGQNEGWETEVSSDLQLYLTDSAARL